MIPERERTRDKRGVGQDPWYQMRHLPAMVPLTGPHHSSRTKERPINRTRKARIARRRHLHRCCRFQLRFGKNHLGFEPWRYAHQENGGPPVSQNLDHSVNIPITVMFLITEASFFRTLKLPFFVGCQGHSQAEPSYLCQWSAASVARDITNNNSIGFTCMSKGNLKGFLIAKRCQVLRKYLGRQSSQFKIEFKLSLWVTGTTKVAWVFFNFLFLISFHQKKDTKL